MHSFLRIAWLVFLWAPPVEAHVVSQIYGEWREAKTWEIEVVFDAGFADPLTRNDPSSPAPEREWLTGLSEDQWGELRIEAERYLRESLVIETGSEETQWVVTFPDFEKRPPDFPRLLNDGAYFRVLLKPVEELAGPVAIRWTDGRRPDLVIKLSGKEGAYLTFKPGDRLAMSEGKAATNAAPVAAFRQGFLHVVPQGWDHVLFVLGLFFYRRKWRPLLAQSLAFTAAHTVTLGLAAAGVVRVSGNWVEPVIALSLVAVALENLRPVRDAENRWRLVIVFGFGLIHGLGFAGALSAWLKPGEGFLTALLSANLGVEVAQAALLAAAWVLTIGWNRSNAYRFFRVAMCLGIAAIGGFWFAERTGLIG